MKNEDKAQKRFCDEITFQRNSSKSLLCSSHLFKIMTTDKTTKKRRLLSAAGFADNLERLLNISGGKQTVTLEDFRAACRTVCELEYIDYIMTDEYDRSDNKYEWL